MPFDTPLLSNASFDAAVPAGAMVIVRLRWANESVDFGPYWALEDSWSARVIPLGTGTLTGRVLDEQGRPVSDVEVSDGLEGEPGHTPVERAVVTDAHGFWRLDHCHAGRHTIRALRQPSPSAEVDTLEAFVELGTGERRTIDLGYDPDAVGWTGRVRLPGGAPLNAWCDVTLTSSVGSLTRTTDREGRYSIRVAPGRYSVTASTADAAFDGRGSGEKLPGQGASGPSWIIERDLVADIVLVSGRVSGTLVGDPAGGRTLWFDPLDPNARDSQGRQALASIGAGGAFGPVVLPPGRYHVELLPLGAAGDRADGAGPLVGRNGQPVLVEIVDGGEITGLELRVAKP